MDRPIRQPRRFSQLFQKADFSVSLSAEKLVFVSIGIIMLLVVFFALGVERGKAVSAISAKQKIVTAVQPATQPHTAAVVPVKQALRVNAANAATGAAPTDKALPPVAKKPQVTAQPQAPDNKGKPYTIVAAAFSKEVFAVAEVSRLKAGGIEAFVYHSEPYYLTCVGAFTSKDTAQKTLSKVRQTHRDAYVRLR